MNDKPKSKTNEDPRPSDALSDAELENVAGGGLRDALRGDTGGLDPRGPGRTAEGNPLKGIRERPL